ncbi:hypothetical protein AB1Y20_001755 [Prymnesium parvum]|uniref:RCK C-terminal domain-containing protein n=1 Tax=Prymnesium parvum TaxID=97485 RepID=A0AB34KCZ5_PRYPA
METAKVSQQVPPQHFSPTLPFFTAPLRVRMAANASGPSPPTTRVTYQICDQSKQDQNFAVGYLSLLVICMASWKIAALISDNKRGFSLPRGSGCLLTGLVAGTFRLVKATNRICQITVLSHPDSQALDERQAVFFPVNYVCMAFIAYATGSELRIERYRKLFKKILIISSSIVLWVFCVVTAVARVLFSMDSFYPSSEFNPDQTKHDNMQLASAALVGAILTSRSPASAISIIGEMRAKGVFTQLSLGVTIFMYFIVNVVFALMDAIASIIIGNTDSIVVDIGRVFTSLVLSMCLGMLMGVVLYGIAGLRLRMPMKRYLKIRSPLIELYIKAALALALGFAVFFLRMLLNFAQKSYGRHEMKITIVPLLSCLVSGVVVTNFRKCKRADEFSRICKSIAPYVYCSFFTLVGATIDFEAERLPIAGLLGTLRVIGVIIGSYSGGALAREPSRRTKLSPMNYVTQAGVALGFAEEIRARASESDSWLFNYGELGDYIYTVVAMVVVCNQLIGPPLYKLALRLSGDAFIDRIGGTTLITVEGQTPQIQIKKVAWEVRAGPGGSRVAQIVPGRESTKLCRHFDEYQLPPLLGEPSANKSVASFPFICMLEDDQANYEACKLAQRLYGTRRCIVQQNDLHWKAKFNELGGLVLDPDAIVVEPLQQFLGSAQSPAMVLHNDPKCEVVRVFIDQSCAGLTIAQCGLPKEVQVLEVRRMKTAIVPRAFTKVLYDDELMLCGRPSSLADVTAIKKGRVTLLMSPPLGWASSSRLGAGPTHRNSSALTRSLEQMNRKFHSLSTRWFGPGITGPLEDTTALYQVSAFEDEFALFLPGAMKRATLRLSGRKPTRLRKISLGPGEKVSGLG